jgi:putative transposase
MGAERPPEERNRKTVTPYDTLLKAVQDARIFRRNGRPLRSKILACLLYLSGLSYRGMTYQTGMIDASHVSVFRWVHATRGIVSRVPRKERKLIAIDETKLKINGRQVFVWAAIDADTKELLAVYASSYYRSSINQSTPSSSSRGSCRRARKGR